MKKDNFLLQDVGHIRHNYSFRFVVYQAIASIRFNMEKLVWNINQPHLSRLFTQRSRQRLSDRIVKRSVVGTLFTPLVKLRSIPLVES